MERNIPEKVTEILVTKMGLARTEITDEASFTKDLGIDSLDIAELVMEFEKTFDIKIPDSDVVKLSTVSHAVGYIQKKIAEKH